MHVHMSLRPHLSSSGHVCPQLIASQPLLDPDNNFTSAKYLEGRMSGRAGVSVNDFKFRCMVTVGTRNQGMHLFLGDQETALEII